MRVLRRIRTVLLIGGAALGLSACVAYDPYPYSYGYGYSGYYGGPYAYAPYAAAPSVSLGFSFADHERHRWR